MGVPVTGTITVYPGGIYASIDPTTGIDGWRSVANETARNLIVSGTPLRCRQGMAVWTQNDNTLWTLNAPPWAGTNADWTAFTGGGTVTLSGDVSGTGTSSITTTLATVNSNVGTFGSSTAIPSLTVNGKGLITSISTAAVIAPAGTLTGTTLASNVVSSSLTSVGTITSGTWNGTAIANAFLVNSSVTVTAGTGLSGGGSVSLGSAVTLNLAVPVTVADGGTGDTTLTAYAVLCGGTTSTGALQQVSGVGSTGQVLTSNGSAALPTWQPSSGGTGTVTTVSVASANGFAGTVATATTTPAITISTTITGILKGNGTSISAATAGVDYLSSNQTITLSGDATGSGATAITTTLATVNSNVGSFGSSTSIPNFTVNAKGLITAAGGNVVIAPAGTLTGTTLNSTVVASSLTSVGTITSGTWQGTAIATGFMGATVRPFTAILGQGVPVVTGTNSAGNYLICSNAGTFTRWDMAAVTGPTGASLVIDVLKSANQGSTWTSLWNSTPSNRPTIASTNNNGSGTAFDTTTFAAGDWLRFDIITVGSSVAGQGITLVVLSHMNQ